MADPKRVLLVSSHALFAQGLRSLLSDELHLEIIGLAVSTAEALEILDGTRPEIVIVDRDDEDIRGREFVSRLDDHDELRVIMVTLDDDHVHVYRREQVAQTGLEGLIEAIDK